MVRRIISLDYGKKRIGVAVSDPLGITSQLLPTLNFKSLENFLVQLSALIKEYDPEFLLIGLPLDLAGKEGEMSKVVKSFGDVLKNKLNINIEYFDERYTSLFAERALKDMNVKIRKNKGMVDSISAQILLQGYMERKNAGNN